MHLERKLFGAKFDEAKIQQAMTKVLEEHDKEFQFHPYDDAGHAFFSVDRPSYRVEAAKDGWKQIWAFFGEHLGK